MDSQKTLIGKSQRLMILPRSSDPNGKRRVGAAKLPGSPNKKRIISHDDDSLSLFAPSDVEEELKQEEGNPLRKVMFVVNDTAEAQSEGRTDDILCGLTEEFNNDKNSM